ncbi:hypothetical protein [Streptosporangium lutulentum]|uniref:Uncharacterized protein n=1 Tax=Streptosporangium lutulentum TaxID=1461250 RepID=A0ABT9QQU7_9ACTN|nr:hypothetical protein [Streptosporangium lutulentum]MDP9849132.1 hypothetical protein [Streptosporangium lutulentum]
MDPEGIAACVAMLEGQDTVRLRGIHAHLASDLDAARLLVLAEAVLTYA